MLIFLVYEGEDLISEAGLNLQTPTLDSESTWQQFLPTIIEVDGQRDTIAGIALRIAKTARQIRYSSCDNMPRHLVVILTTEEESADCFSLSFELPAVKEVSINVFFIQERKTIATAQITAHTSSTDWDTLLNEPSITKVQLSTYDRAYSGKFYAASLYDSVRTAVTQLAQVGIIGNIKTILMTDNRVRLLQFTIEPAQAAPASHAAARKTH